MANSPGHKLGQLIGKQFEAAFFKPMAAIAEEYKLYLDYPHMRRLRGRKKRVGWQDSKGNTHYLDYVLEEGGSEDIQGRPRAFVEVAWRSYTKHSKNKAQEIEGAITPLADTYQISHPFLGVILSGHFTQASLTQFQSNRFTILHCPYDTIVEAFNTENVDVSFKEKTSDEEILPKINKVESLTKTQKDQIADQLRSINSEPLNHFLESLGKSLSRYIECVYVLPLTGTSLRFGTIEDAVLFISAYNESTPSTEFAKYELNIRYSNNDEVRGTFREKERAVEFLKSIQ